MSIEFQDARPTGRFLRSALFAVIIFASGALTSWIVFAYRGNDSRPAIFSLVQIDPEDLFPVGVTEAKTRTFLATQKELVTSPDVISHALRNPDVSQLPAIKAQPDPSAWLLEKIHVELLEDARLLEISVRVGDPIQQAAIVNAVTRSYVERSRDWSRQSSDATERQLLEAKHKLAKTLAETRAKLSVEVSKAPDSAAAGALRDEVAVAQELWKRVALALEELQLNQGASRVRLISLATPAANPASR